MRDHPRLSLPNAVKSYPRRSLCRRSPRKRDPPPSASLLRVLLTAVASGSNRSLLFAFERISLSAKPFTRKNTQLGTAAFLLRTVTLFLEAFKRPFKMIPQANLLIAKSDKWPCARPGSILFAVLSGCAVRDLGASSEGKSCLRLLPPSLTFAIRRTSKVLPRLQKTFGIRFLPILQGRLLNYRLVRLRSSLYSQN